MIAEKHHQQRGLVSEVRQCDRFPVRCPATRNPAHRAERQHRGSSFGHGENLQRRQRLVECWFGLYCSEADDLKRNSLFTRAPATATMRGHVRHARRQRNLPEPAGRKHLRRAAVRVHPADRLQPALLLLRHRVCLHRRERSGRCSEILRGSAAAGEAVFATSAVQTPDSRLPLVELTGGEPLLQNNSLPLMQQLCDDGFTVLLETSGAHDIAPSTPACGASWI